MRESKKKKPVKVGESCSSNKNCINNNCVNGVCECRTTFCVRTKTIKKKLKAVSSSKTKSKNLSSTSSSFLPVKKKKSKKKRVLIIDSSSPEEIYPTKPRSLNKTIVSPYQSPIKLTKSSSILQPRKAKSKKKRLLIIESSSPEEQIIIEQPLNSQPKNQNDVLSFQTNLKSKSDLSIMPLNSPDRLNDKYIEMLDSLVDIMNKKGEPFRARAYKNAQETIMSYPYDIKDPEQLKGKPSIGPTIMEKLVELKETGTLRVLEREKNNPVNIIANLYGIGPKKAQELVDKGITSIDDLREQQHLLNDVQKVGLLHYDDIQKRIPRSEIDEYYTLFEGIFLKMNIPDSKFKIVGSYRRGLMSSGDIDVILTAKTNEVYKMFLEILLKVGVLKEFLSRGSTKALTICKLPESPTYRRVDFLYASEDEFPFALLYFTGSKTFNTVMRGFALKKGLTMNEHGLYHMDGKKKTNKVNHKFYTENDIFDFLGLEYKSPEQRIDGRAVHVKTLTKAPSPQQILSPPDKDQNKITSPKNKLVSTDKKLNNKTTKKNYNQKKDKKSIIEKIVIEDEINPVSKFNAQISIVDFKEKGIKILDKLNESQLAEVIRVANMGYYNKQPLLTDNQYDIIKEYFGEKYPNNIVNFEVGANIEKNKVKLPYEMWSMDKIKPDTNALFNWMNKYKGPYVLSAKLDGVSGMYSTEGSKPKLYTRGNGFIGQDISHFIPYLRLPKKKDVVIRGEFIISKEIFASFYKDKFANPRNMVAGIINQKSISPYIKDVNFIAYEVIKPVFKPSEQISFLKSISADTVVSENVVVLSNELLSDKLIEWRMNYRFEIDGIIVTDDKVYSRKSGNPAHAFAFKMVLSDQIAEAKVVDVIWTPSKDGYLKPRVQIEPIHLGGVKIEYATGFNAAFIQDNKIGIGALIQIIRSGDVIPHIQKIVEPADKPLMPTVPYKWNSTHVDIMLENTESNEVVREKNITGFFRGIGVDGLSTGIVKRLIDAGYNTVPKITSMSKEAFLSIEGFKNKLATKIFDGIKNKVNEASLIKIMSASNVFGRGFSEKKIELIMNDYPEVLSPTEGNDIKIKRIMAIKGMALKTAELFVEKIPDFLTFLKESNLEYKLTELAEKPSYDETNPLFGKTIVLTGFRDNDIINQIKRLGGKQGSSISSKTDLLIVKDEFSVESGKAYEAVKLNIPIITKKQFIEKYM